MEHNFLKGKVLLVLGMLLLLSSSGQAQARKVLWQAVSAPAARGQESQLGRWFTLDVPELVARLALAPAETRPAEAVVVELPYPDGSMHRFAITQIPVMAPALAARYPQIQTYAGWALDEPATSARLAWTPAGLQAQVLTPTSMVRVATDAATPGRYQSRPEASVDFECLALPGTGSAQRPLGGTPPTAPAPYGAQLRTLRLALAATGEYVQNLGGGSITSTVTSMVTLVNNINAVYERDLSLRLQLVANTDQLIYLDPTTDPYDNSSPVNLMNANDNIVKGIIGAANYDIGHVLGYRNNGYSGVAYVGVVCSSSQPAGGSSTGSSAPLMTTVVTHEIGHQFGSAHTFNGNQGTCTGNRSANLAYEPGAGNTIMSYDSRCAPDNVGSAVHYFHAGSISAILPRLTCGTLTTTGNQPPSVSVPPSTYTIPLGTPFALTGSGTDSDALTYSWEELDLGNASGLLGAATDVSGPPLFRSFALVASPTRTFPALPTILNNITSLGEILPLVARSLNFRLTARDNRGGVAAANIALTVAEAGPFRITAPAAALTVAPGSLYTLTWDVLGTDQPPVSCASVRILFSSDGGLTFPTVLLASTPNNGSAQVRLPRVLTTQGRVKVQALDNVFFAINNANLRLVGPLPVELTSFTAEARHATAHLTWITASEKNNKGFAVEASAEGITFRRIGWVAGQGSTSVSTTYRYTDGALATYGATVVYYRLRQTDTDGTESFSPVRTVAVPRNLASSLQLWPNPTRGHVTVSGLASDQPVQLLDLTGRVLLRAILPATGSLDLVLPVGLPSGVYVVRGGGHSRRLAVE